MADRKKSGDGNRHQGQPRQAHYGVMKSLPHVHYNPEENNALMLQTFEEAVQIYVRAKFPKDMDNVFEKGASQAYPQPEEAVVSLLEDREISLAKYRVDYARQTDMQKDIDQAKPQICGLIQGQMSNASKEQLRTTAAGLAALEGKDPIELINQIRNTHLLASRTSPGLNYEKANAIYTNVSGSDRESLSQHKKKLEAAYEQLRDAARRAGEEYVARLPTDAMIVNRFIKGLAPKYGAYVRKIDRKEKDLPATLQAAYDDVINHGTEYVTGRQSASEGDRSNHVFYTGQGGRGGGRGGGHTKSQGGGRGGRGHSEGGEDLTPGTDGRVIPYAKCSGNHCGKRGHWLNKCPIRAERKQNLREDDAAISSAVQSAKGAAK